MGSASALSVPASRLAETQNRVVLSRIRTTGQKTEYNRREGVLSGYKSRGGGGAEKREFKERATERAAAERAAAERATGGEGGGGEGGGGEGGGGEGGGGEGDGEGDGETARWRSGGMRRGSGRGPNKYLVL